MDENKDRKLEAEDEKELMEKIRRSAEKAEIPRELSWENMQKKLWGEETDQGKDAESAGISAGGTLKSLDTDERITGKRGKRTSRLFYKWGAAAAVLIQIGRAHV